MKDKKIESVQIHWWKLADADKEYVSIDSGTNALINVQDNKNAINMVKREVDNLIDASFAVRVEYRYEGENNAQEQ